MGNTKSLDISTQDDCFFVDFPKRDLFAEKNFQSQLKRGRSLCNKTIAKQSNSNTNFKRINSLPPTYLIRKKQQKNVLIEPRNLNKGFDMIRNHFGQKDCEWSPRLTELETSILLLNEKISDLEISRQDCLKKLLELKRELEHSNLLNHDVSTILSSNINKSKIQHHCDYVIRIKFIENFMKRLENLLHIDQELFFAIASPLSLEKFQLREKIVPEEQNNVCDQLKSLRLNSSESNQPLFPELARRTNDKREQIKKCYDYLLKTVMPQLYGNSNYFIHKSSTNYHLFRQTLLELRRRVQQISTQQEQQLIDAKRAFLMEVDSYLKTLDEMIKCD